MFKFRLFIIKPSFFSLKNFIINLKCSGIRAKDSLIILEGNFYTSIHKSAKININKGLFFLNKMMRSKEPFIGMLEMDKGARINVFDTFVVHSGCHIIVLENAELNLGSGYINRNLKIRCHKEISIGNNVAISENVTIWDSDAHQILGKENFMTMPVNIGNDVWIGNNVTILKGVKIGHGAIIAAGSLVNKNIPEGCLAGGVPAKVLKENVSWN